MNKAFFVNSLTEYCSGVTRGGGDSRHRIVLVEALPWSSLVARLPSVFFAAAPRQQRQRPTLELGL